MAFLLHRNDHLILILYFRADHVPLLKRGKTFRILSFPSKRGVLLNGKRPVQRKG
jgi:hypothetical protein